MGFLFPVIFTAVCLLTGVRCDCVILKQVVMCKEINQVQLDNEFNDYIDNNHYSHYQDLTTFSVMESANVYQLTRDVFSTEYNQLIRFEFIKFTKTGLKNVGRALVDQRLSLKALEISYSELEEIPKADGPFKKFHAMNLFGNKIKEVRKDAFNHFQALTRVNLSDNAITHLGSEAFARLPNLMELDLSYNRLTVMNNNALRMSPDLQPGYLTVDLSNNQIMFIPDDSFPSPLLKLDLSRNQLQRFKSATFKELLESMVPFQDSVIYLAGTRNNVKTCDQEWLLNDPLLMCRLVQDPAAATKQGQACRKGIKYCMNYCDYPYASYKNCVFGDDDINKV